MGDYHLLSGIFTGFLEHISIIGGFVILMAAAPGGIVLTMR